MMKQWPSVSIIIPTNVVGDLLRDCIAKCQQLDYPRYEIIVIPDRLPEKIKERGSVRFLPVASLPGEKKNKGASVAVGEILAFLDADAYPTMDWLSKAVPYLLDKTTGAVGGPNLTPAGDNLPQRLCGMILSSQIALGKFSKRYRKSTYHLPLEIPSCNLLVKKEIFRQTSGFPKELLTAEDS
ncbi:MAG: glycosyltransferase, partial [Candidatus Omnitrophica bacterium]|nr:glycosyltransferase [Candidatus Omnitrophota bacterium]